MIRDTRAGQARVASWNLSHSIGTAVVVVLDDGSERKTKTRSLAEMLGGHTPVIWLDGIAGAYALERVRPE